MGNDVAHSRAGCRRKPCAQTCVASGPYDVMDETVERRVEPLKLNCRSLHRLQGDHGAEKIAEALGGWVIGLEPRHFRSFLPDDHSSSVGHGSHLRPKLKGGWRSPVKTYNKEEPCLPTVSPPRLHSRPKLMHES